MFDYKFLMLFIVLSIINVVFATIKSIITVNGNKWIASVLSGGYYAFYNIMMLYTVADFPMWQKCVITFVCNLIGVFVVKWTEEKARKAKLWKVEATVYEPYKESLIEDLRKADLTFNYIEDIGKWNIFNVYCETKEQSANAKYILDYHKAKYFVSESKNL